MSIDSLRREAARVAAHVELRDVRLWSVEADLRNVPNIGEAGLSYKFDSDVQIQHNEGHAVLLLLGTYNLDLSSVDAGDENSSVEDDRTEPVAEIAFTLNALFEVEREPDEPFTEDELTAFGQTTGQFAIYPYARELIADLTRRMGLPQLHIGLMRLHLETRDG